MKSYTVICLIGLAVMALARPDKKYTDKYDDINLDEILANRRLLLPYLKCMLDEGKCTADGKELKSHIREALEEDCAKCTKVQFDGTRKVLTHLFNHEQEYWERLKAKYDPTAKYTPKIEKEIKAMKA